MSTAPSQTLALSIPLREEPLGVFRVGNSRVLLELVIGAFKAGATPEAIVQSYDTLDLGDVYAVIAYYLANPEAIEEYLRRSEEDATAVRERIESLQGDRGNLRGILVARAAVLEQRRATVAD